MKKVGVLALQGSVTEHMQMLSRLENIQPIEVKTKNDLNTADALIIPGGESTTMGKLLTDFKLKDLLIERINNGLPTWGTCAGMILMANNIVNEEYTHLSIMDISVKRNAYGSQLDSFKTLAKINEVSPDDIELVFIRAPWIERVGNHVNVLLQIDGKVVAARDKNMLVTSFHPELTEDLSFHKYFVKMII